MQVQHAISTASELEDDESAAGTGVLARLRRGGGWLTLVLTLIMLVSVAGAVNRAEWSEGLIVLQGAMIGGALLGFLLALTRWQGAFPALYSFLTSIIWTATLLHQTVLSNMSQHDAVEELVKRNIGWFTALFSGAPNADNLIFLAQLCLLGWWIAYFAIWSLIRYQRVLHAVLPAGVALLINAYYSPYDMTGYFFGYLGAVVLLAIWVELARNETHWQLSRVRYASEISLDFLRAGVIFAVLSIGLAWTLPNLADRNAIESITRPFDRTWKQVEDTWSRMYRSLRYPGSVAESTAFGKSLALGGPVSLTDRPIFRAETPEQVYWRSSVFDTYTGDSWQNTDSHVLTWRDNHTLPEPVFDMRREITVTIRTLEARQDVIFGPPQPARVSLPLDADAYLLPGPETQVIASLLRSRLPIYRNYTYRVASLVSTAPPELLRADRTAYPTWITERYLQIPDIVPVRVRREAYRVTASFTNPYDKAVALEAFLRNYEYNKEIAAPPAGRDAVDYFLFGVRKGYCDYYASAMVILLRAVGIPARFVTGYVPGELIQEGDERTDGLQTYQIVERHAHAWPEVYFPTYGWIQFEPTASEPTLTRPVARPTAIAGFVPEPEPTITPEEDDALRPERGRAGPIQAEPALMLWLRRNWVGVTLVLGGGGLAAGLWLTSHRRRQRLLRDPNLLGRLFGLLGQWAGRLRVPWPASHTPLEHATALSQSLPEAEPPVNRLAGLFVAQQYGRQEPSPEAVTGAVEDWRGLQPIFWRGWLARLVRRSPAGTPARMTRSNANRRE